MVEYGCVWVIILLFYKNLSYCPGKEAALGIIVSAAADPLYRIPLWIFDCAIGKAVGTAGQTACVNGVFDCVLFVHAKAQRSFLINQPISSANNIWLPTRNSTNNH